MGKKRSLRGYLGNLARQLTPRQPAHLPEPEEEAAAPRSVLFLGGINTLMEPGYTGAIVDCLSDRHGPLDKVTNFAVDGNSIVHGLMLAKGMPDIDDYDLVVIEYGINDTKLASRGFLPTWRAAAEGLIRHLLDSRPDRRIVFVQFHRRHMQPFHFRPAAELRDLAAYYGQTHRVLAVDIDGLLRRVLFTNHGMLDKVYTNGAHLRRPVVSTLIGAMVAAEIMRPTLAEPDTILPPPVRGWNFQSAELIDFIPDRGHADRVFRDDRFVLPARMVPVGERISVDLPGPLIGIEFIATASAATLRATEAGGEPFSIQTRAVGAEGADFLLRFQPMAWKQWHTRADTGRRELRVESLLAPAPPEGQAAPTAEGLFLSRALCLG